MTKFKIIFVPFILALITIVMTLAAVRWLFEIKLGITSVDKLIIDFFIPAVISLVSILVLMKKRLRILQFKKNKSSSTYKMIMAIAIAAPACITQLLVSSSSYDLVKLDNVKLITSFQQEKYFKFTSYRVSPERAAYEIVYRVTGKHNQHFNMSMYIAVPFTIDVNAWYGLNFHQQISNRLNEKEKEEKRDAFIKNSREEFSKHNFYNANYFELVKASGYRSGLKSAIDRKQPYRRNLPSFILNPKDNVFEYRDNETIKLLFWFTVIPLLIVMILLIKPKVNPQSLLSYTTEKMDENDDTSRVIKALTFRSGSPETAVILNLCIISYFISVFLGLNPLFANASELAATGGIRRDLVLSGEYWRLVSAVFVHAGFIHLIMNTIILAIMGRILEPAIGTFQFLSIFFFCSIVASLTSIAWHPLAVSVGASGAIYGIISMLMVLTFYGFIKKTEKQDVWLIASLVIASGVIMGFMSNIDHAAHLGGFIAGLFCAGVIMNRLEIIDT